MGTLKNNVKLIGHVGQEPTITTLEGGKKVARLSLATNESYKNNKGDKQIQTHWHTLVAWGKLADFIELDVFKGMRLAIAGALSSRSFEDKQKIKRYTTEVIINEILILERLD